MIKFVTFQKRCVNSSITDKRPNLTKRNKPTSSSGLMMPNCTLLIVRSGHALSPEGGPCILCIQRDASFLGTSLCEQHDPGQAANGERVTSAGDIPRTTAAPSLLQPDFLESNPERCAYDNPLPFLGRHR